MRKMTQRKGSRRVRRILARRAGPLLLAVALLSGAWMTGHLSTAWRTALDTAVETSITAGFQVRHVLVSGRSKTDRQTLVEALGIEIGEAMFAIDLEAARARVTSLAWVRDASIRRRMPDTVVIELVERRPLAMWQHQGELFVVDTVGEVIGGAQPEDHSGLFLVVGPGAPAATADLLALLGLTPDLAPRVLAAVRIGQRRWKLHLDGGIDIHLPEDGVQEAWLALAGMDRSSGLLSRDVMTIDLRLPDRLVVRLTEEARERLDHEMTQGEDT